MIEAYCHHNIYVHCERIYNEAMWPIKRYSLVRLRGEPPPKAEPPFSLEFFKFGDEFSVWNGTEVKKQIISKSGSTYRKATGLMSRNGERLCDAFVKDRFNGDWVKAMQEYGTFRKFYYAFIEYFKERRELLLKEQKKSIEERKNSGVSLPTKFPASHGGVANLLKVLTKTMELQGASIKTIAKVQYAICQQAGILIPDEFITDCLVAMDINPALSYSPDEELSPLPTTGTVT